MSYYLGLYLGFGLALALELGAGWVKVNGWDKIGEVKLNLWWDGMGRLVIMLVIQCAVLSGIQYATLWVWSFVQNIGVCVAVLSLAGLWHSWGFRIPVWNVTGIITVHAGLTFVLLFLLLYLGSGSGTGIFSLTIGAVRAVLAFFIFFLLIRPIWERFFSRRNRPNVRGLRHF